jgi:type IV pilus assembly protein PilE
MKVKQQSVGFTLIEMLIVIVIIGVLASYAYNTYIPQVDAARRTDALTVMMERASVYERHYTENNRYNDPASLPTGYVPIQTKMTNRLLDRSPKSGPIVYWTISSSETATTYSISMSPVNTATVQAERVLRALNEGGGNCGVMSVNNAGVRSWTTGTEAWCFKR